MGYVATEAQARTIPIYVVATAICLATAYATDRLKQRYSFAMGGLTVAGVGYSLLLAQQHLSVGVKYFALFLTVSGGYTAQPIINAWLANNMSGHYKRSVAAAVQIGLGNSKGHFLAVFGLCREQRSPVRPSWDVQRALHTLIFHSDRKLLTCTLKLGGS
jgi:hypothetical protein